FDDTDRESFLFQERTLLDVELEVGPERPGDARLGAEVADTLELVDQADAILVPRVVRVLQGDLACHDAAGDHRRLDARALLVGEDRQRHGVAGPDLRVVEAPDDLEAAENPQLTVVATTGRYRVHVGPHHDGWESRVPLSPAEDVAHLVDGDREPRLAHP